jgi:nucleoside phosphorylase
LSYTPRSLFGFVEFLVGKMADDSEVRSFSGRVASAHKTIAKLKRENRNGVIFVRNAITELETVIIDTSQYIDIGDDQNVKPISDTILTLIQHQYTTTLRAFLKKFLEFIEQGPNYEKAKESFFYPLLELYIRDPAIGGPGASDPGLESKKFFYGYLPSEGMYETSITRPFLFHTYLKRQIEELIKNHRPVVRVRPGPSKIPIHFAIEANEQGEIGSRVHIPVDKMNVNITNRIPLYFDVPKLGEIDDIAQPRRTETLKIPSLEFVNACHFRNPSYAEQVEEGFIKGRLQQPSGEEERRDARQLINEERSKVLREDPFIFDDELLKTILDDELKSKTDFISKGYEIAPLALFNGDRADYSLGRIRHYTKTFPRDFQNFVIFTNYQMYVDEFLKYCMSAVFLRALCLCIAASEKGVVSKNPGLSLLETAKKIKFQQAEIQKLGEEDYPYIVIPGDQNDKCVLTAEWLIESIGVQAPSKSGGADKLLVSEQELDVYARVARAKCPFVPRRPKRVNPGSIGAADEQIHTQITRRLLAYFLRERTSEGLLGPKSPQMPAYHLVRAECAGISMVNIGVGPSNAKTITDHIAVLRPYVFLMLGHCAGLRTTQKLGHYVLASGYFRADGVLDPQLRKASPIPAIEQIDDAVFEACRDVTGAKYSREGERHMSPLIRVGTVMTVMDRNWELTYPNEITWPIETTKSIGLDMESGTVAANGFRLAVPYATFLCVSDRPLHGDLKLEGMADSFYRNAVGRHFQIAIRAVEALCKRYGKYGVPTRRLRSPRQPPFQ